MKNTLLLTACLLLTASTTFGQTRFGKVPATVPATPAEGGYGFAEPGWGLHTPPQTAFAFQKTSRNRKKPRGRVRNRLRVDLAGGGG